MKITVYIAVIIVVFSFTCSPAFADIYRYKDENGVWHFTNIQRDKRYRLYLKTSTKKSSDYIKDYGAIIEQASKRFNVESSLIKAIIKAESDFDHNAVSKKGARGLMQLMPKTADDMEVYDPHNPEENIFGGARYLSILLERFNHDKRLAIAAYNAGPESVEAHNGVPPFPETEAFIAKVFKYFQQFQSGE